ncbi:MAG: hypothetical protein AABY32_05610 [Nanoarchaeota archaeon]
MKNKLVMKLLVDGVEKQRLEATLLPPGNIINRKMVGLPKIYGNHHVNPEAINNVETAYKTFESIHNSEYPNKKVTIELTYK